MRTVLLLFTLLIRTFGVIFNETAYTQPLLSECWHKTASFGLQPGDGGYERVGVLVLIQPESGCGNIENAAELKDAVVLVKRGNCSFFDIAWNIASLGGAAMVLGNNNTKEEYLVRMSKDPYETRNVDIPCVFIKWTDYRWAKATIEGDRHGTVIATVSPADEIEDDNWWVLPTYTQFVTCLIIVLPTIWALLTIQHFFRRDMANRRQRRLRRSRTRQLPEVLYSKDTQIVGSHVTNSSCPICLENFEERIKINRLPCEHGFHVNCIGTWIAEHSDSCPICRQSVIDKLEDADSSSARCWCSSCIYFCHFRRRGVGYRQQLLTSDSSEVSNVVELCDRSPREVQAIPESTTFHLESSANSERPLVFEEVSNGARVIMIATDQEELERSTGL